MAIPKLPSESDSRRHAFIRDHPGIFARRHLGIDLWYKQREVLNALSKHKRVAVRSCNGSGKTFTAALAAIWWLMAHENAVVITTAPTERQVRELLWREIRKVYDQNRDLIGGKISSTRLELSNQRFAFGFSTDTAGRFQGFHNENILIIVDEASEVREFIFDAILGSMSSRNARMLLIGNPTKLAGTFYDAFHKNRGHWKTIHISAFDTPAFNPLPSPSLREGGAANQATPQGVPESNVYPSITVHHSDHINQSSDLPPGIATPEYAELVARERGKDSHAYQVRVLGEFPSEAIDTLIPLKLIEDATKRIISEPSDQEAVMGLDVARFGDAMSVAVVRRGPQVIDLVAFRKTDLMQTTGKALDLARRHDVKTIYVDEIGMGAGVLDRLNEINDVRAEGVNVANKADETERYANLRAQMFDGLRQRFADDDIAIPDDAELISQLASLTYIYNSRGQLQLESKDDIRRSGRQSPDKADALALAFHVPWSEKNPMMMWIL